MANDLYAHTMDIRQWISPKEAQELRFLIKMKC